MILKIKSKGAWSYYDEIESCTVDAASTTLKLARMASMDGLYLGNTEHFDDGTGKWDAAKVVVRCVTILTRGDSLRIGFDGEAFLCNDKGHTLQRIVVGPLASVQPVEASRPPGPHPPPPAPASIVG